MVSSWCRHTLFPWPASCCPARSPAADRDAHAGLPCQPQPSLPQPASLTRGVDAHCGVQLALGQPHLHGHAHALHNLSRVGANLQKSTRSGQQGLTRQAQQSARDTAGERPAGSTPGSLLCQREHAARAAPGARTMWQPTTTSLSAATMSFMKVRPGLPLQNGGAAQRGRSGNQHQRRGSAGHAKAAMIKARTARLHASRSAQCSATDQASPTPPPDGVAHGAEAAGVHIDVAVRSESLQYHAGIVPHEAVRRHSRAAAAAGRSRRAGSRSPAAGAAAGWQRQPAGPPDPAPACPARQHACPRSHPAPVPTNTITCMRTHTTHTTCAPPHLLLRHAHGADLRVAEHGGGDVGVVGRGGLPPKHGAGQRHRLHQRHCATGRRGELGAAWQGKRGVSEEPDGRR